MTDPKDIATARRIIALGLADFVLVGEDSGLYGFDHYGWAIELEAGQTADHERIQYVCVVTEAGPELLPALDDWALVFGTASYAETE